MSVVFSLSRFLVPGSILRYRRLFSDMEKRGAAELRSFQEERLQKILRHAEANVSYYAASFQRAGVQAGDLRSLADLARFPILTKDSLRNSFDSLTAANAPSYRPFSVTTSGTSGRPLTVLLDRSTNGLEFAYYWRYWNWAGYRLGDRFGEFSSSYFLRHPELAGRPFAHQRGTGRVLINSLFLSESRSQELLGILRKMNCRFLKGLPSVLKAFAQFMAQRSRSLELKAVFATGEVLLPSTRSLLESTFGCPVRDSYGHMERVAAASECEEGRLHVNSDYGLVELVPEARVGGERTGLVRARVVATGLHNFSMPLIRYDVGDTVELDPQQPVCVCGRSFPVIARVEGRSNDVIRTPDGKVITTMFLAFDQVPGIRWGQFVQEKADAVVVRVLPEKGMDRARIEQELRSCLSAFTEGALRIDVIFVAEDEPARLGEKFRMVVSTM